MNRLVLPLALSALSIGTGFLADRVATAAAVSLEAPTLVGSPAAPPPCGSVRRNLSLVPTLKNEWRNRRVPFRFALNCLP